MLALSVFVFSFIGCGVAHTGTERTRDIVLKMTETRVTKKDDYVCEAKPISDLQDTVNVVGVEIRANPDCVHHAVVAACESYISDQPIWDCKHQQGHICSGRSIVFLAWVGYGERHGMFEFPEDVSVNMGKSSSLKYTLTQVHYADPSKCQNESAANVTMRLVTEPRPYLSQGFSFGSSGYIPAKTLGFNSESACVWQGVPAFFYAYDVHTHGSSTLVEAYVVRDGAWILLGRKTPIRDKEQVDKPNGSMEIRPGDTIERFDIPNGSMEIRPGDIIAARCIYDNKSSKNVMFGPGGNDEMCNFNLDFKYSSIYADVYTSLIPCFRDAQTFSWKEFVGSTP